MSRNNNKKINSLSHFSSTGHYDKNAGAKIFSISNPRKIKRIFDAWCILHSQLSVSKQDEEKYLTSEWARKFIEWKIDIIHSNDEDDEIEEAKEAQPEITDQNIKAFLKGLRKKPDAKKGFITFCKDLSIKHDISEDENIANLQRFITDFLELDGVITPNQMLSIFDRTAKPGQNLMRTFKVMLWRKEKMLAEWLDGRLHEFKYFTSYTDNKQHKVNATTPVPNWLWEGTLNEEIDADSYYINFYTEQYTGNIIFSTAFFKNCKILNLSQENHIDVSKYFSGDSIFDINRKYVPTINPVTDFIWQARMRTRLNALQFSESYGVSLWSLTNYSKGYKLPPVSNFFGIIANKPLAEYFEEVQPQNDPDFIKALYKLPLVTPSYTVPIFTRAFNKRLNLKRKERLLAIDNSILPAQDNTISAQLYNLEKKLDFEPRELGKEYNDLRIKYERNKEKKDITSPRRKPLSELLIKCRGTRRQIEIVTELKKRGIKISRQLYKYYETGKSHSNDYVPPDTALEALAEIFISELTEEFKHWNHAASKTSHIEILKQLRNEQNYLNWRERKSIEAGKRKPFSDFVTSLRVTRHERARHIFTTINTSEQAYRELELSKKPINLQPKVFSEIITRIAAYHNVDPDLLLKLAQTQLPHKKVPNPTKEIELPQALPNGSFPKFSERILNGPPRTSGQTR